MTRSLPQFAILAVVASQALIVTTLALMGIGA